MTNYSSHCSYLLIIHRTIGTYKLFITLQLLIIPLQLLNIVSQVLMALIEDHQAVEDEEGQLVIEEWKEEVSTLVTIVSAWESW